jgi:hypothetical protein
LFDFANDSSISFAGHAGLIAAMTNANARIWGGFWVIIRPPRAIRPMDDLRQNNSSNEF